MKVNFLSEITSFYRWNKSNHLSNNAQLLWFNLFCYWNEAGFPPWLQIDVHRLMGLVNIKSKSTLLRARDELINNNLLLMKTAKHKTPNKYQFNLFLNSSSSKIEPQTRPQTSPQTSPLYKLNETKLLKEKTAYGEFKNIFLTDEEYQNLEIIKGIDIAYWIERLGRGKRSKGYKYNCDYSAILEWIEKDKREESEKIIKEMINNIDSDGFSNNNIIDFYSKFDFSRHSL